MKKARKSFGPPHECAYPWPDDCFVQCGGDGIVIENKKLEDVFANPSLVDLSATLANRRPEMKPEVNVRRTAFFEAFPKNPNTFLRGEGDSVESAEAACWDRYQKIQACERHEFERRGRTDGYCYCKHCGLSGSFMAPTTSCATCSILAAYGQDKDGNWYCKEHCETMPKELWPEWRRLMTLADCEP